MAIKDILVHLDDNESGNQRASAAIALAKRTDAHVIGIALAIKSSIADHFGLKMPSGFKEAQHQAAQTSAEAAAKAFQDAAAEAGVSSETLIEESSTVRAPDLLAFHARHTDITFVGQPHPDDESRSLNSSLLEGVLFNSGRPAYIVPYIGRRVADERKAVIAWDGGTKSARAVNDAIPLLQQRGETVVLVIDADKRAASHGPNPGRDIAAHLKRHGIEARIDSRHASEAGVDNTILNYLAESGADLLVMGAFGHSRLRERAFGGVTHTILQSMTAPVLMSN